METESFRRLQALFEEALQQPRESRADWMVRVCGADIELRNALTRLVALEDTAASDLEDELVGQLAVASRALAERNWEPGSRVRRGLRGGGSRD